jgi:hypothetical protein
MKLIIEAVDIAGPNRCHSSDRIELDFKGYANPRNIMQAVDKAIAQARQRRAEWENPEQVMP